ncbi:MAG: Gfo/Idh/MocA family oxidoreductase [Acidimicrobiales bacterium]
MDRALRVAVVGVGRMGAFHAHALTDVSAVDVVAVADSRGDHARSVARDVGAVPYGSPAALLERDDVDAWLIATPTVTHPGMVDAALDAGLHVLCEKPLALDPDESEALGARARAAQRVLQVGFWRRFSPPWAAARQLLDAGTIGRPVMVRLAQWDAAAPPADFCDPAVSGGLAIDCGVHEFDLVTWLTGLEIETVTARNLPLVDASVGAAGDVDNLLAVLDLTGGAVATVDLSRNCRYGDDVRTEILGEDGAIFVDLLPTGRARLATAAGVEVVSGSVTDDAFEAGVAGQAVAFAEAVSGSRADFPGAGAAARAVATGRAVQQAATGAPVALRGSTRRP